MSNISNIVKVYFPPGKYYADIKDGELFQYDTGQILELHGLNLPATVEVNFSIRNSSPTTDRIGHTVNGITQVSIPNVLLEQSGDLKAYICVVDADAKSTEYVVRGVISRKPRSSGNISTDPSGEVDMLSKAIQTVNDCTVRSEVAKESAESAKDRVQSIASNFEQTASQSLTDISTAKTGAVQAVEDNKAASVQTINDTGSAQVTAITDTGTTQVQAVQAEGATQVQAVQEAAAEIMADRQQIQANTSDISALSAGLDVSATAIIRNASGGLIDISDSAGKPLRGMSVYGKSFQNKTEGTNLADYRNVKTVGYEGLTITSDSDGVVTVNGTSTVGDKYPHYFTYYGKDVDLSLLEIGQVYKSNYPLCTIRSDGSVIWGKFTFAEDIIRVRPYIKPTTSSRDATFNNVKYKPMLYKDTGIVPDWEPFTGGKPAPSPDFTQEIKNAGDSGSIDMYSGVGGRNLALETSSEYSSGFSNFNGTFNTCIPLGNVLTEGLKVGDTATVHLFYKYENITPAEGKTAACLLQGCGDVTGWGPGTLSPSSQFTLSGSGEIEILHSFDVTSDHLKNSHWSITIRNDYVQSGTVYYKMFKVERGEKATDWTPAFEYITPENETELSPYITKAQFQTPNGLCGLQ